MTALEHIHRVLAKAQKDGSPSVVRDRSSLMAQAKVSVIPRGVEVRFPFLPGVLIGRTFHTRSVAERNSLLSEILRVLPDAMCYGIGFKEIRS